MKRRPISKRTRFLVLQRDGFKCIYCGAQAPAATLHVDHRRSVYDGGPDDLANLAASCSDCNLGKGRHSVYHQNANTADVSRILTALTEAHELSFLEEYFGEQANLEDAALTLHACDHHEHFEEIRREEEYLEGSW